MSLEQLCLRILGKPTALDVMLLFDKPVTILQPLCDLLDNWKYDEFQGEYQPVYQQFGAILLLVLAFTTRYNLSTADLGIRSTTSFVAKFLSQGYLSRSVEELTSQEQEYLHGWIGGLFDNESGAGLGDELMERCLPQNFYLMIPTLFHQVVLACSTKNLSDEALNSGLEFLVDVFLLPALVPAITWLSSHLWENRGDANTVLQILAALIINPPSGSEDAANMLNICIKITSKTLEHSLRWLQRAEPTRQDVEPLSKALRPHLGWERRGASDHVELETWCATPGGGLSVAIKQTVSNLFQWALGPGLNVHPANYTHRQLLVGVRFLGAKRVLNIIVDEVKAQTDVGNGGVILDIACALICAPDAASWDMGDNIIHSTQPLQRRLTLREALKNEIENAPKLHKSTSETAKQQAETLIRIYRKVEAQSLMPQQPALLPQVGLVAALDDAIMAGDVGLGVSGDALGDAGSVGLSMDALGGVGVSDEDIMSGLMNDTGSLFGDGMGDGMGF
jgi:mediator of RNA polymerase II transcription subunit 5